MKVTLLLSFIVALCAIQASAFSAKKNLSDFISTIYLWHYYPAPSDQSLSCFNETSSEYFFQWLEAVYNVSSQMSQGNLTGYQAAVQDLAALQPYIIEGFGCKAFEPEYKLLLSILNYPNYKEATFKEFTDLFTVYFTGNPAGVQDALSDILQQIAQGKYIQAGMFASDSIWDVKKAPFASNALMSWFNGIFVGLNLPAPSHILNCLARNPDNVQYLYDFYYLWSEVVNKARLNDSLPLKDLYLNSIGEEFYNLTGSTILNCVYSNPDSEAFALRTGFPLNPYDVKLNQLIESFVGASKENNELYSGTVKNATTHWDAGNFLNDGLGFANLYDQMSKFVETISI